MKIQIPRPVADEAPVDAGHPASLRRWLMPALALLISAALLLLLQRLSERIDYHSVVRSLLRLTPGVFIQALLATALSYLALIGRDAAGLRYLGAKVPPSIVWLGATVGSAVGNATGFGALTGGAVRVRIYGSAGVKPAQVARLTLLISVTLGLGLVVLTSLGMLYAAPALGQMLGLPPSLPGTLGAVVLIACAILCIWCRADRPPLRLGRFRTAVPARSMLLVQIALAGIDVAGAALALWVMLPHAHVALSSFICIFAASMLLGMIGHTPGGIGVFEASMVFALGGSVHTPEMVAALLAYRAMYFGVPLLLSAGLLAGFEVRNAARRFATPLSPAISQLAPMLLAVVTYVIGGMLVISGATPAFGRRLAVLKMALPLWVLESSQLLASVLGVMLLFVARGLLRRLDAAWWLAMILAVANLALSLAKGLAFLEAGVLAFLIVLLAATRHRFNRSSSLFDERFTLSWLLSVGIVLVMAVWMFSFAFRSVPFSQDLWWEFAFDERASRSLRATVGAALFAAIFAFWQLLRPAAGRTIAPLADDLRDAASIVRAQERSDAGLAMMGDKSFLFSPSREAFLMYGKRGRSWVALHDPVGPRADWADLIGRFVALAHSHGGRAAFYQVRSDALPLYLDAGLTLMKLGEEAHIRLPAFDLDGPRRANLRYAIKRGVRDGLSVQLAPPAENAGLLPILDAISEAWRDGRPVREKGFSVASLSVGYLAHQSVMLALQHGKPVAFVTFMTTDRNTEATVGVMRHMPGASPFTMEYLFTQLALHLKQAGLHNLSLGMAPLSGLAATPLSSQWHRIANLVWLFGGRFYNFQGLRVFKGKFHPAWEPRYLAASGSVGRFVTLADLALLTGAKRL